MSSSCQDSLLGSLLMIKIQYIEFAPGSICLAFLHTEIKALKKRI